MKKLLSLILASLILSMSAAMVSADEAETPAAEATAPTAEAALAETEASAEAAAETEAAPAEEAAPAAETTDAAAEAEPAAEAETEEVVVKVLTEGEEGYIAADVDGMTTVNVVSVADDTDGAIDPRLLVDHNGTTGVTYTHTPESNPILNLAFELDEPTVVKSFAFSCSVDTAGAVTAFLYATNDLESNEWTYLGTDAVEAGEEYYTYNTVEKYVRAFKYYRVMLVFTPVDAETNEADLTLPATFLLTEVELLKEAPEEPVEPANNLPSFPIYNNPNSFTNHIG